VRAVDEAFAERAMIASLKRSGLAAAAVSKAGNCRKFPARRQCVANAIACRLRHKRELFVRNPDEP